MKSNLKKICILAGICLLVVAGAVMLIWQWNIDHSAKQAQSYVATLRTLLPEPQSAVAEPRRDNTMASLSIDGNGFVGILELPGYGSSLPVGAAWGNSSQYPCRFSGSIYDGTLQIGATTQKGQYDFYREISVGDSVYFTDVEGNRFCYVITALHYAPHADQAALLREDSSLTLFINNVYAFEYLIVYCNIVK